MFYNYEWCPDPEVIVLKWLFRGKQWSLTLHNSGGLLWTMQLSKKWRIWRFRLHIKWQQQLGDNLRFFIWVIGYWERFYAFKIPKPNIIQKIWNIKSISRDHLFTSNCQVFRIMEALNYEEFTVRVIIF